MLKLIDEDEYFDKFKRQAERYAQERADNYKRVLAIAVSIARNKESSDKAVKEEDPVRAENAVFPDNDPGPAGAVATEKVVTFEVTPGIFSNGCCYAGTSSQLRNFIPGLETLANSRKADLGFLSSQDDFRKGQDVWTGGSRVYMQAA